ncbi:MAG: tetratricopeptide repeat protein [Pseudomonadales bacterium]
MADDPNNPMSFHHHIERGARHMKTKQYGSAAAELEEAVKCVALDTHVAYNMLAGCYLQLSRLDDAERAYEEALSFKPDFADARRNLGMLKDARRQTGR